MLGVLKYEHKKNMKNYYRKIRINSNLPKTFDSRIWWMNCTSIAHIWDQGNCGSCWVGKVAKYIFIIIIVST